MMLEDCGEHVVVNGGFQVEQVELGVGDWYSCERERGWFKYCCVNL